MNPCVKTIRPLNDYRLEVLFENGELRLFDVRPYLYRGIFVRLQDRALFRAARVVAGSVEWPGGLDLSYDTLYLESQPVCRIVDVLLAAWLTKDNGGINELHLPHRGIG